MNRDSIDTDFPKDTIPLVKQAFLLLESQGSISSLVFFRNLFTIDPSLRPLIHNDIELQGRKLMQAMKFVVATLGNPRRLLPVLESIGRSHMNCGARIEHYETMTEAMLKTLRDSFGRQFSSQAEAACRAALKLITGAMIQGMESVKATSCDAINP